MELTSYQVFLAVVEEMNFTRAAERLYMTQQGVSNHIKRLENVYHVQLFERRPALRLTAQGEALAFFSRTLMENEKEVCARFADLSEKSAAILRIGISYQRSQIFMPGIWSSYHPRNSNIALHLREQMTDQLVIELEKGNLDLIVGVNIPSLPDFTIIPLCQEATYCVFSQHFLAEHFPDDWVERLERYTTEGLNLMDFREVPFFFPSHDNRLRQGIDQIFRQNNAIPNIALETSSHGLLCQLSFWTGTPAVLGPLALYEQSRMMPHVPKDFYTVVVQGIPQVEVSVAYRKSVRQPHYLLSMVDSIVEEFQYYDQALKNFLG